MGLSSNVPRVHLDVQYRPELLSTGWSLKSYVALCIIGACRYIMPPRHRLIVHASLSIPCVGYDEMDH